MASGLMSIRYSDDSISTAASTAYRKLDDIMDTLNKVRNKLDDLPERSSRNNLSRASAFLIKKNKQLETRQGALEVLKQQSSSFMSRVETTEKRLSSSIKQEYKQFHKQTGIGKSMASVILEGVGAIAKKLFTYLIPVYGQYQLIKDTWGIAQKAGEAIKNWYESLPDGAKYALKAIGAITVAVVAVVATIASFGAVAAAAGALATTFAVLSAVGATIAAADAVITAFKASGTLGMHLFGHKDAAREMDSMSTADALETMTGGAISAKFYNGVTTVGSICSLAGGIGSFATKVGTGAKTLMAGSKMTGKEAFKQSLKAESLDKVKGLFGTDDVGNLRSYLKDSGGFKQGMKNLFTSDIGKLIGNKSQSDALKGIKAVHDLATLGPITDIADIFSSKSLGSGVFKTLKFVF